MAKKEADKDENKFLLDQLRFYDLQIAKHLKDDNIYYLKALTLIKLGKRNEALNCLNKAIEINPETAIYYAYKALLYAEIEDYQQAGKMLEKVGNIKLSNSINDKKALNIVSEVKEKIQHYNDFSIYQKQAELETRIKILEQKNEKLQAILDELQNILFNSSIINEADQSMDLIQGT